MKVANYRKFLGFTQSDFAKIFGISLQAYSRKERGKVPFTDAEKMKLKKIFSEEFPGITIDEIFFNQKVTKVANKKG